MYHTILFDLDGTVTDSKEGITKSVQYALRAFSIEEPNLDKLECFIGPPLMESFIKYYSMTPDEANKAVMLYRERYQPVGCYENTLYEGMRELLISLRGAGKTVCLATSKPEAFACEILKQHGILSYFTEITGSELNGERCQKADVIHEVFRRLSYSEEQKKGSLMVGDREHDIIGAKAAGIACAGIRYGFSKPGELEHAQADYIFDTIGDLKKFLLNR